MKAFMAVALSLLLNTGLAAAASTFTYEYYHAESSGVIANVPAYPLGSKTLTSDDIHNTCTETPVSTIIRTPQPACWQTSLGSNLFVLGGEDQKINDYLTINMNSQGRITAENDDWKTTYTFSIYEGGLTAKFVTAQKVFEIGKPAQATVRVENNIAEGIKVVLQGKTTRNFKTETWQKEITPSIGVADYTVNIPADELGKVQVTLAPAIKVYTFANGLTNKDSGYCLGEAFGTTNCVPETTLLQAQTSTLNYIVSSIANPTALTTCASDTDCPSSFECSDYGDDLKICDRNNERVLSAELQDQVSTNFVIAFLVVAAILLFGLLRKK